MTASEHRRSVKFRATARTLLRPAPRWRLVHLAAAAALLAALTLGLIPAVGAAEDESEDGAGGGDDPTAPGGLRRLGGPDKRQRFVPGELLVRFRSNVDPPARSSLLGALDATTKRRLPLPGLQLVRIGSGESVPQAAAAFKRRPEVRYAEPNFIYQVQATPNDPRYDELWGLNNTGQSVNGTVGTPHADIVAPEAWDTTTGDSAVTVAVVDTGVAYDHPDLAPNIYTNPGESGGGKESNGIDDDGNGFVDDWRGWDFFDHDNDPRDLDGHGTHVAGTIGARGNNGQGVVGVNWQVGLMPVRVLGVQGYATSANIAAGFAYAGANGAQVVNASLGFSSYSQAMADAIEGSPNTLFVVAAGNSHTDNDVYPFYPCSYDLPNIVCVAATTQDDGLAYTESPAVAGEVGWSNYGAESVDLGAPGTNILSTQPAWELILSESFKEDISSTWSTGGTNDSWARTTEAAKSGSFSLTDSPGGDYLNNTNSFARTTSPLDLSGRSGCRLEYELKLEAELNADWLLVEASSDGTNWTTVTSWTGFSGSFVHHVASPATAQITLDGEPEVFIGFRLISDESATNDGAHIDDVTVRCITSTYAGDEFRFVEGTFRSGPQTSIASPYVAGAAALLWAQEPSTYPYIVKSKLLSSVDPLSSLGGKTVSGGRLNVDRALDAPLPTPDTYLDSGPAAGSTLDETTPTFSFSSHDPGATFECQLDEGGFSVCSSPLTTEPLADGSHDFEVRAVNADENHTEENRDPTPATRSFTVDTAPPETQIVSGPTGPTNDPTPRFEFSSNERGAGLECRLDGGSYSACHSPRTFGLLADGPHTFEVRATDAAGNTDPSAASRSFTVDTQAPDTQFDSGPSGRTSNVTPSFAFHSSEEASSFECRLDGRSYSACSSPQTTPAPLLYASHTFEVRATDAAGNTDPSPASRSFTTAPPARGKTVIVARVKGLVRIREPRARRFHRLRGRELIAVGSRVDTSRGRVRLTSAARRGKTQTADFYRGAFQVRQRAKGRPTTELRLLSKRSRTRRGHRGRNGGAGLWGNGHGDYTTHGKYGSATVRGTIWFTQNRPTGTYFKVRRGVVVVRDFTRHRKLKLHPGQHYLAPVR
jgi:subtilisin family serine protease